MGDDTLFDFNFLALGVPPDEGWRLARRKRIIMQSVSRSKSTWRNTIHMNPSLSFPANLRSCRLSSRHQGGSVRLSALLATHRATPETVTVAVGAWLVD
jgi:hypothetical protein